MNRTTRLLRPLAVLLCAAAVVVSTTAGAAPCTIDGAAPKQTIDGFGFASVWSGRLSTAQNDLLFGTGNGQLGFTLLRVRIDPNRAWADETANAAAAHARGAKVLATPWTPPASMKTNNNTVGGSLRPDQYAAYATYLNQAATSIGADYISLQNEPDWDPDYEGCTWTPENFVTFLRNNAQVITKPIVMPEALGFNDRYSDPSLNDPTAASRITVVAGHFYGNGNYVHTNAINKGKRVWMTEHYVKPHDIGAGVTAAKEINDAMNNMFNAYFWWWVAPGSETTLIEGTTPRKTGWSLGQFAKYVRPGMTRIGTTYAPTANVTVTAYKNNTTVTVVAVNTGASAVSQTFNLQNLPVSSLTAVRTSGAENMATVAAPSVSNNAFTYNLPAQSITTFSGPLGGTTTYALTVTKSGTGSGTVAGGAISCGATCSANVSSGTPVTLAATPASGSTFGGWSGACTGTGSCVVTMTAARAVTATFNGTPVTTPALINVGGAASGTWAADTGFSGGSTYAVTTAIDTSSLGGTIPPQAVLQAERYGEFTYTLGGFTAGSAQTVTLYFAEVYWTAAGQRTFNVAINGSPVLTAFDIFAAAGGAGKAISRTFDTTASAGGQVVIQLTRAGGPDNPKLNAIAVGATGPGTEYALTVTKAGAGGGTVSGAGIDCGATCSATYASGATVTLTATAASGSTFGGWSGACTGTSATCTVSMTAARTVTASFGLAPGGYTLTVTKAGTGSGTVTGAGLSCGAACSASYDAGTTVTLTATAASGSTFGGWGGACTGTPATCAVSMTSAQAVTATFNTVPTDGCKTASGGQSGNFNTTGAVCYTVNATVNGWGCSNAEGRTVTVNGTAVTCGQTPLPGSAPYTFRFTAGTYPWASFYWW